MILLSCLSPWVICPKEEITWLSNIFTMSVLDEKHPGHIWYMGALFLVTYIINTNVFAFMKMLFNIL
jgi:hypothetical protein